ncbi:unnamed protein product [Lasius platythorax]|uniref:Uncharacterized protein n=1 Tax=Lasius platythorax TaxID=488582 RepID=A0AAV2NLD1_9HYME
MTGVAFYKEGAGIRIPPERRYNTWIRIGHKALFVIPYCTYKRGALRVVTTTGVPGSNFVIRDSEESSIVKKGRSIWDASAAEKLSRCRTQRVLPGILAGFELATERITQRTNAVQRIFLR